MKKKTSKLNIFKHKHANYLFLALIISSTFIILFAFFLAQQVLRQSANDPQIQIAQDLAQSLSQKPTQKLNLTPTVDYAHSLSPIIMVFDSRQKLVATNLSDSSYPTPP